MDAKERARLRALADAASGGPWKFPHRRYPGVVMTQHGCLWNPDQGVINDDADGVFIAAARTAIPALLDALDAADARIAALTEESFQRTLAIDLGPECGGEWGVNTLCELMATLGYPKDLIAAVGVIERRAAP